MKKIGQSCICQLQLIHIQRLFDSLNLKQVLIGAIHQLKKVTFVFIKMAVNMGVKIICRELGQVGATDGTSLTIF